VEEEEKGEWGERRVFRTTRYRSLAGRKKNKGDN
jgi:hypothetical protein